MINKVLIFLLVLFAGFIVYLRFAMMEPLTVYTDKDIIYIDYWKKSVYFESGEPMRTFKTYEGLTMYVEEITALHITEIY